MKFENGNFFHTSFGSVWPTIGDELRTFTLTDDPWELHHVSIYVKFKMNEA